MSSGRIQQIWETFVRGPEQLKEDAEIPLIIRDLTPGRRKYRMRHVVAVISRRPETLSDGDTLWVTQLWACAWIAPGP